MSNQIQAAVQLVASGEVNASCKKKWPVPFHISDEEVAFIRLCCATLLPDGARVAEVGATLGATTMLLSESLANTAPGSVEVFSKFEHTRATRTYLSEIKSWQSAKLFDYWTYITERQKARITPIRGDLRAASEKKGQPLGLVYVDGIREPSEFAALNNILLKRMSVGGILLHHDYFYWGNPWAAIQMETLADSFELVGDVGYSMGVYVKKKEIAPNLLHLNAYDTLSAEELIKLIDRASKRFTGARRGLLRVSKLRLMHDSGSPDAASEQKKVVKEFGEAPKVKRYLDAFARWKTEEDAKSPKKPAKKASLVS